MIEIVTREQVDRADEFLRTKGKKLLFYHQDSDGICSAALLLKFFPGFEAVVREGPRMDDRFVEEVLEKKPSLVVFLDLPVDQELPKARILVIDHHIPEADLNSERILHINHMFTQKVYIPTSYQVYRVLERMGRKMGGLCWISAIGIIGDYGFKECHDFLLKCKVRYPELLYEHPMESKLAKASEMISSAVTLKGARGAMMALDILVKAKRHADFAGHKGLVRLDKRMKAEVDKILDEFSKKKEEHPELNLIIFEVRSKLNITSVISSILARLYPDDIIIIRKGHNGGWKISARSQTGIVNLGEIIKKCVSGIGSGGGHEKAAGAMVNNWEEFKARLLRALAA
ncbi:MAG: DHHA1 domain-containing protein [Candidatus Aenigmatarchaeota archaeon]